MVSKYKNKLNNQKSKKNWYKFINISIAQQYSQHYLLKVSSIDRKLYAKGYSNREKICSV